MHGRLEWLTSPQVYHAMSKEAAQRGLDPAFHVEFAVVRAGEREPVHDVRLPLRLYRSPDPLHGRGPRHALARSLSRAHPGTVPGGPLVRRTGRETAAHSQSMTPLRARFIVLNNRSRSARDHFINGVLSLIHFRSVR